MAIQMTREEYRLKFGEDPIVRQLSNLDTSVAPRRMTRDEYNAQFGINETKTRGGLFTRIGNAINSINPLYQIPKNVIEGGLRFGEGLGETVTAESPSEALKGVVKTTAGVAQAGLSVPIGIFEAVTNLPGLKQVKDFAFGIEPGEVTLPNIIGDKVSDIKPLQNLVVKYGDTPEVAGDIIMTLFGALGVKGVKTPKLKSEIQAEFQRAYDQAKKIEGTPPTTEVTPSTGLTKTTGGSGISGGLIKANVFVDNALQERLTNNIEKELFDIENRYAKTRKAMEYQKDAGSASRRRIAQTDVMIGAVDSDGIVRTKQPGGAIEQYRKQTIDGIEGVVRENLVRLGENINLFEVRNRLTIAVNESGLEGADLINALNGIEKEIAGLALKSDPFGNLPLVTVHDAKISTTRNIDFNTPAETKTYRKAIARSYKKIVEDKSSFNTAEVNAELAKYYTDISLLERLDGRRVRGGRLGKYFAQVSGNIIGGAAGSVAGPAGAAVGAIVGGEAAGFIKGKMMERTFGDGGKDRVAPKNEVLELAKETAKTPAEFNLKIPDNKVGAPAGIVKDKEILKLERQISENVEAQKKAINAKDYTLVSALKKIYQALIQELKNIIQKIKDTPNKEGGFIKNPLANKDGQSKSRGSLNTQYNKTNVKNTNVINKVSTKKGESANEAKKFKTADEFIEAQPKVFHGTNKEFDKFTKDFLGANQQLDYGEGISFTDSRKIAKSFGDIVMEVKIDLKNPAKNKDLLDRDIQNAIDDEFGFKDVGEILKEKGFDGIEFTHKDGSKEFVVFDLDKIKTKSQLKKIWEEANKK